MAYTPNNPNGSAVSASSAPVVIASDQLAISTKDTIVAATIPTATVMQNAAVAVGVGINLNVQGYASAIISISGTMSGSTIVFKESPDDVTFSPIAAHQIGITGNLLTTTTSTGEFRISCAGLKSLQAVITVYGTGSITVKGFASPLAGHGTTVNSNIIAALPTGTNTIGNVGITGTTLVSQKAATSTSATLQAAAIATGNGTTISTDGMSAVVFTVSGTYVGTITFEGTEDGTNYTSISATQLGTTIISSTTTSVGVFEASVAGLLNVRARLTWTSGTSVTVTAHAVPVNFATRTINANVVSQVALPTGANAIGSITNTTFAATQTTAANLNATIVGTGTLATQVTSLPALATGTNGIGTVGTTSAVINVGQKVTAITATQVSATSTIPTNGIVIQALSTNAASIFVGGSTVTTTTGFELTAGQSMSFTANLNTLYIVSVTSTTDKICWNVE